MVIHAGGSVRTGLFRCNDSHHPNGMKSVSLGSHPVPAAAAKFRPLKKVPRDGSGVPPVRCHTAR
jgi:hypothetical protein